MVDSRYFASPSTGRRWLKRQEEMKGRRKEESEVGEGCVAEEGDERKKTRMREEDRESASCLLDSLGCSYFLFIAVSLTRTRITFYRSGGQNSFALDTADRPAGALRCMYHVLWDLDRVTRGGRDINLPHVEGRAFLEFSCRCPQVHRWACVGGCPSHSPAPV